MASFEPVPEEKILRVGYWNMRGLGSPLRMMCFFSKTTFKAECWTLSADIDYKSSAWFSTQKPIYKERQALINLPYVIDFDSDGSEIMITQTNACMAHLGRKLGLWGVNVKEISMCEMLLCEIYDLRNVVTRHAYGGTTEQNPDFIRQFTNPNASLGKLEIHLSRQTGFTEATPFLVGGHATAPDFHLFELLDQFTTFNNYNNYEDSLVNFPNIKKFYVHFGALPQMAEYLSSKLFKEIGLNNLGANFGSMPSGEKYDASKHTPPADASGTYSF
jgi:glutathione S-transferase